MDTFILCEDLPPQLEGQCLQDQLEDEPPDRDLVLPGTFLDARSDFGCFFPLLASRILGVDLEHNFFHALIGVHNSVIEMGRCDGGKFLILLLRCFGAVAGQIFVGANYDELRMLPSLMQASKHRLEGFGSGERGSLAGTNLFSTLVEVVERVFVKLLAESVDEEGGRGVVREHGNEIPVGLLPPAVGQVDQLHVQETTRCCASTHKVSQILNDVANNHTTL